MLLTPNSRNVLTGWSFWFIAALFYAYELLHRVVPSILTTELRAAFSINEYQLGIIGAMYFYAYAAFQLPAGILIDRYGAKRILVIASGFLTLGSFLFATTTSGIIAQMSRFLIGAGSAFAFVGCLKIGAQWLSMNSFPLIVGLTNLLGTLGALTAGPPLSYMVSALGWREVLMQMSFAGLAITFILWIFLRDKKPRAAISHSLMAGLIAVMKNPQSWLIATYGALLVIPIITLPEMWGVEYLQVAYEIPVTQAASLTHTIFIGTAIGGPLIGWLATYIHHKLRFMMISSLGALTLLTLFIYWTQIPFSYLYVILFVYGILTANMLLCFTFITKLNPPWAQGAAIGFINMIIMASGGLAQHGVGWMLNHLGASHLGTYIIQDYQIALSILPLCLLIAIVITRFIRHDNWDDLHA